MQFEKTDPRATAVVLLVILLVAGALYLRLSANAQRLEVPTFRAMAMSTQGEVHAVVGNTLFIESPGGESLKQIDLADWGVEDFHGDLGVMDDGSVVLARGQLGDVAAGEAVRIVARATSTRDPVEKLMRCQPATNECTVLEGNGNAAEIGRAFGIDTDDKFLYVSEPAKHRIHKLSLDGEILATHASGWKFPNDIRVAAFDRVGFVDTNNHRYIEANSETKYFGAQEKKIDIGGWPEIVRPLRFPLGGLVDETDALWMLVARDNMSNATLYRKPPNGDTELVSLPANADPLAIGKIAGSILVADTRTFRIYRFNMAGEPQADFGSPTLKQALAAYRDRHDLWQLLFDASLIVVLFVAVPALVFGYRMQQKTREEQTPSHETSAAPIVTAHAAPRTLQTQYAHLNGELIFWRKHSALSTDTERWFLFAILLGPVFVIALVALLAPQEDASAEILQMLLNDPLFPLVGIGLGIMLVGAWLSGMFERLIVNREGIRYTSLFPAPLSRFLMPSWFLRWDDIREVQLQPGRHGAKMPALWHYEIVPVNGKPRKVKAFHWRLAGEKESGLQIRALRKLTPEVIRAAIAKTQLYRVMKRGMQDDAQQAA